MIPRKTFDQLSVGDLFPLPARTVTDAHFSLFQALSGDNHPIHYDIEYCQQQGHPGMLAHGLQVLCFTAVGAGTFPHTIGDDLIGFLDQRSSFLAPTYPGDTLTPQLEVTALDRQNTTGVVTMKVTVDNQKQQRVLEGEQRYLVRLREKASDD